MTSVLRVTGGDVELDTYGEMGEGQIVAPTGAACVRVEQNGHVYARNGIYSAKDGSPAIAVFKDTGTYKDFNSRFLPGPGDMKTLLSDYTCGAVGDYMWSASNVRVVNGETIRFNTRRSSIESYIFTDTESLEAKAKDFADYYSCAPLTISIKGNDQSVCQDYLPEPAADSSRLKSGIDSATFLGWSYGGSIITTTSEVLDKFTQSMDINGTWAANVSTAEGFKTALKSGTVKKITLDADITLTENFFMDTNMAIDLNGHTIHYAGSDPLFDMTNELQIQDSVGTGGIVCTGGAACIATRSDLTVDGGSYQTNGPAAVTTIPTQNNRNIKLLAGTFLSTATDGHGLMISTDANYEPYIGLLSNTIITSVETDYQEYICFAKKLTITKDTDPTYVLETSNIAFLNMTYGNQNQTVKKIEMENTGNSDIVVNRITLEDDGVTGQPSKIFSLDGVQEGQLQPGIAVAVGDMDESVGVKINANVPAGTHKGIVTLYYQSLCDPSTTYSKTIEVTITVNKRQIILYDPTISLKKVYDKTKTVEVGTGAITNLVGNDSVSISASASYDNADAGSNKTITLVYTISGADSGNYIAPDNKIYQDGKITKAPGEASIAVPDSYAGESLQLNPVSKTNGIKHITYYYKEKGASDSLYTMMIPTEAGAYTIKAVFAATTNYAQVNAMADFSITQIAAPSTPYTISGQQGSNGWYLSSVTIHPPVGYTISTSKNGDFTTSLVVDASASLVIYLKSQTGAVTAPISVSPIQIDMSAPSVNGQGEGIIVGTMVWNSMANLLDFDRFYKEKQQVVIRASDPESQIASFQYLVSATQMTLSDLQKSTAWESGQSFTIEPENVQKSIIYAKITNGAGLVSYVSSNGLVFDTQAPVIAGVTDGETYYGDEWTFTASDDYLDTVTINGTTHQMTDKENSFVLSADDKNSYQIVATDKSGNRTTITVSVQEAWLRDGISS